MIPSSKSDASVLPQSKKISKPKHHLPGQSRKEIQNSQEYLVMETGYDTFLREEKEEILSFLKKQILALKGLDSSFLGFETSKKSPDWLKLLKDVGAKSLNQLLKKVIPLYRPNLALTVKELTNLRKKIKGWFSSEGLSEKRGDPLIHDDELPRFKEVLREVMKVRNFEQLRKDVLPFVKEIRMQSSRKFIDSMFSKKFWSTFLNKEENSDMKTLWESLPLLNGKIPQKKSAKKIVKKSVENSSCTCESEHEEMETEGELLTNLSMPPEQIEGGFWIEDEKDNKQDTQVQDFINQFDENELEYPAQRLLFDTEDMLSEAALSSSEDKQIPAEDEVEADFLDGFWSAWKERNDSSVKGKYAPLMFGSQESVQRFGLNNNNNSNFELFPLSQDSHKQASFST